MSLCLSNITQDIRNCLHINYGLDSNSVEAVLTKIKPLIESNEHNVMLKAFIELSKINLQNNKIAKQKYIPNIHIDDAVVAAPKYHTILSENDKVRVLWGVIPAGDQEPLHRHYWKSIVIIIEVGNFEIEYADKSKEISYDPVGVYELTADLQAATYKNIGALPSSFLRFEIKN